MHRADRLHPVSLGHDPTGGEAPKRERWLKVYAVYRRAYECVHMAMGFVDFAAVPPRRIGRRKERREPW